MYGNIPSDSLVNKAKIACVRFLRNSKEYEILKVQDDGLIDVVARDNANNTIFVTISVSQNDKFDESFDQSPRSNFEWEAIRILKEIESTVEGAIQFDCFDMCLIDDEHAMLRYINNALEQSYLHERKHHVDTV